MLALFSDIYIMFGCFVYVLNYRKSNNFHSIQVGSQSWKVANLHYTLYKDDGVFKLIYINFSNKIIVNSSRTTTAKHKYMYTI